MYSNCILQIILISIIHIQNTVGRESKISPQLKYGFENNDLYKKSSDYITDIDPENTKQINSNIYQTELTKSEKSKPLNNKSSIILVQSDLLKSHLKNDSIDIKLNSYQEYKDKNENIDDITTDIIELKNSTFLNDNIGTEISYQDYNQTIFEDYIKTDLNNFNKSNINSKLRKISFENTENPILKKNINDIESIKKINNLTLRQNIDGTIPLNNSKNNNDKNFNVTSKITLENSTNNVLTELNNSSTNGSSINLTNLNTTNTFLNESSTENILTQNTTQSVFLNSTSVILENDQNSTVSSIINNTSLTTEINLNTTKVFDFVNNVTELSTESPPTQIPKTQNNTIEVIFDENIFQNCYPGNEVLAKNCTDCVRCPIILEKSVNETKIPKKIRLMFSNKDFNVYKFLSLEKSLRSTLEKEIKESFNLTTCRIIYNYPFPIITPDLSIISFLVININFEDKVQTINEIDIKDHLVDGDDVKKFLESKKIEIENIIQMRSECIKYESDNSLTCIDRPPDVKQKVYVLLMFLIVIILITVILLLIIIFVKRSKSKFKSTRLKLFNDSNLDPNFYDLTDGRSSLNAIRLQNLNRISANEYIYQSPYQQNDGIDLVNEVDILREENNQEENFLKPNSNINGTNSISAKMKKKSLNINEKKVYYNPKYERNSQYLNDNQFNQITINVDKVNNFDLNQNQTNCSDCGFKFVNCDCTKNSNDITITPVDVKNKPPTGKKKSLGQVNVNYDFADTKL